MNKCNQAKTKGARNETQLRETTVFQRNDVLRKEYSLRNLLNDLAPKSFETMQKARSETDTTKEIQTVCSRETSKPEQSTLQNWPHKEIDVAVVRLGYFVAHLLPCSILSCDFRTCIISMVFLNEVTRQLLPTE